MSRQGGDSTLAVDAVRPMPLRNANPPPGSAPAGRPRTVFDGLERKAAMNGTLGRTMGSTRGAKAPAPQEDGDGGEGDLWTSSGIVADNGPTREFGCQVAPLPWARYYFPEEISSTNRKSTMPFFRHFDVMREEDQVDRGGHYRGRLPTWAADRFTQLHYAEANAQGGSLDERGSEDFAPWDTSLYDERKYDEHKRQEVVDFLLVVSSLVPRSPADQEPLLQLQKSVVGYCIRQLEMSYRQAEILFDHKLENHRQALQADLERRKAEVQIEEREKQSALEREVERLREDLAAAQRKITDMAIANGSQVAELEKDKKNLQGEVAAEAARQEKVEAEIHELRNVVVSLDNLTIKDKADVDRLHSDTIKQIAQVSIIQDEPIQEHAQVIAKCALRWVLRALTGASLTKLEKPVESLKEPPRFHFIFEGVATDDDFNTAMDRALAMCYDWNPSAPISVWRERRRPRGSMCAPVVDGEGNIVENAPPEHGAVTAGGGGQLALQCLAATREEGATPAVGTSITRWSAPAHFAALTTSRAWRAPRVGGGHVIVVPIYPDRYEGAGRTLGMASGVLCIGGEERPPKIGDPPSLEPDTVTWGGGDESVKLAVYMGLCSAISRAWDEVQRENAKRRAEEAGVDLHSAGVEAAPSAVVNSQQQQPATWWQVIERIGVLRNRERAIVHQLEDGSAATRSLAQLRTSGNPVDTVTAVLAAVLLILNEEAGLEAHLARNFRVPYEDKERMQALWECIRAKLDSGEFISRMRALGGVDFSDHSAAGKEKAARFAAGQGVLEVISAEGAAAASRAAGLLREWGVLQGMLQECDRLRAALEEDGHSHYSIGEPIPEDPMQYVLSMESLGILEKAGAGSVSMLLELQGGFPSDALPM